ncbi:hypothetical protein ACDY96_16150 [Rhizobium mongolense]|uniref:hypothetical protein n=1 Tax=Rhizobium mongolense TaxID=57676 RepID=UPI003555E68F
MQFGIQNTSLQGCLNLEERVQLIVLFKNFLQKEGARKETNWSAKEFLCISTRFSNELECSEVQTFPSIATASHFRDLQKCAAISAQKEILMATRTRSSVKQHASPVPLQHRYHHPRGPERTPVSLERSPIIRQAGRMDHEAGHEEFYALAKEGASPSHQLMPWAARNADFEARIGAIVRQQEREQVREQLSELQDSAAMSQNRLRDYKRWRPQTDGRNQQIIIARRLLLRGSQPVPCPSRSLILISCERGAFGAAAAVGTPMIVRSIFNREGLPVWEVENAPVAGSLGDTWTFSIDEAQKFQNELDVTAYVQCGPSGEIEAIPIYDAFPLPGDVTELTWSPKLWAEHIRERAANAVAALVAAEMGYYDSVARGDEYGAGSIRVLEGLPPVRKRPDDSVTEQDGE